MARKRLEPGELEPKLGYRFSEPELLRRALTHVSATGGDPGRSYQRLEFLGDRVLGLAVSDMLFSAFPNATEGELSHRLSELVRREACAAMAERWDLGTFLILGPGEGKSGGRRKVAILADAAEAVIGAVFIDGGFPAAKALCERALADPLSTRLPPARDPKTALQEWAQAKGRPTPVYVIVDRSGPDHAPSFRVASRVEGLGEAIGAGGSRRAAEQAAAEAMLVREGVWPGSPARTDDRVAEHV